MTNRIEGDCPLRFGFALKGTVPFNAFSLSGEDFRLQARFSCADGLPAVRYGILSRGNS